MELSHVIKDIHNLNVDQRNDILIQKSESVAKVFSFQSNIDSDSGKMNESLENKIEHDSQNFSRFVFRVST